LAFIKKSKAIFDGRNITQKIEGNDLFSKGGIMVRFWSSYRFQKLYYWKSSKSLKISTVKLEGN
jgi:hypothetical protein